MKHNTPGHLKTRLVKPSDIVFTAAIAAVGFLLWFLPPSPAPGQTVVIRQDGAVVAALPLSADATYEVRGTYTNIFKIDGGTVRVAYTDCPNHRCEKTGAVGSPGESIVCAPNHTSATVEGKGAAVDAIAG